MADKRPYLILLFPGLGKGICYDRDYMYMTDDKSVWGKVTVAEIIETSRKYIPPHEDYPSWVNMALARGNAHIALWVRQ